LKKGDLIMFCRQCGTQLDEGTKFCNNCGEKQEPLIVKPVCQCGYQFSAEDKFCKECGSSKKITIIPEAQNIPVTPQNHSINHDDLKKRIMDIYTQEIIITKSNIMGLFFVDHIPPAKLQNAINNYAFELKNMNDGESVVWLYDDTNFSTAKKGFILTTKRLFSRNDSGIIGFTEINDILEITHKKGVMFSAYIVKSKNSEFVIDVSQDEREAKTALFGVLEKTVKLLKGSDVATCVTGEGAHAAGSIIGGVLKFVIGAS